VGKTKTKSKTTGGTKPPTSQEVKRMRVTKALALKLGYNCKDVVVAKLVGFANHPSLPDTFVVTVATGSTQEYQVVVSAEKFMGNDPKLVWPIGCRGLQRCAQLISGVVEGHLIYLQEEASRQPSLLIPLP
jgi:hypothetical protein